VVAVVALALSGQPSLTQEKMRRLELTAGAPRATGQARRLIGQQGRAHAHVWWALV
jgi:hypothetical protein